MASLMKGIAVFFLVVGIISTILAGSLLPVGDSAYLIYTFGVIGSLISFGVFYSIGYGLELLERILAAIDVQNHAKSEYRR